MTTLFQKIKRALQNREEHLQPFTGKKRVNYDVETHSTWLGLDEIKEAADE